MEAITTVLTKRFSSLSQNQSDSSRQVTREVRLCLQGLIAPEQVSEATVQRGTLVINCRSAAAATTLYFRREAIKQNISVALGARVSYLRLRV